MKERPILFSGPMVRAILEGRKTMTRRVVNPQPRFINEKRDGCIYWGWEWPSKKGYLFDISESSFRKIMAERDDENGGCVRCPYGVPGDRLWVRETFCHYGNRYGIDGPAAMVRYVADGSTKVVHMEDLPSRDNWTLNQPSIFMPRWASRITLEITGLRVQRLCEISCADAIAEGIRPAATYESIDCDTPSPREEFRLLWDSINSARGYGWDDNPWVRVVEFKRINQEK